MAYTENYVMIEIYSFFRRKISKVDPEDTLTLRCFPELFFAIAS